MKRPARLRARVTWTLIGIAVGILGLGTLVVLAETHYHFLMAQNQLPLTTPKQDWTHLFSHVEMALVESILWTALGAMVLVIGVSWWIAKKVTAPLQEMRQTAERMINGQLDARAEVVGEDELADLGRTLNELAERLQRQEVLRKTMTADIAHELRTPLSTLKSHMEAFEDGIWEPTPTRIHSCSEEIERLIHLVRDLELLMHMDAPDFTLNLRLEDLGHVVKNAAESTRAAFLQKGVELQVDDLTPVLLQIDPERVTQILLNLLSNALKFTGSGGKVCVTLAHSADHCVLTVSDTGIGISPSDLPFVFERLYRADKSRARTQGGGGLGLTIVKRLVVAHGGTVSLESEPGRGTTATVLLPT
ncbi:HAMP domain-containing histidine kinase [Tumebacillus sp. ITR2]|uniref:histidine kinase n=1 Tax=Tumebacillus amylolyticus TaxID=2801339 RepID=A0ABS1J8A1_9BACL|nr:HAMP domain-containing sensor histidine kinase [Tumebacillus amylolyticus]MBL0386499.1 HAMP domain-containing histidine kinase [Tumebacillus amylolyticus]